MKKIPNFIKKRLDKYIIAVIKNQVSIPLPSVKTAISTAFHLTKINFLKGSYLEFGCCGAKTFRMAYDAIKENKLDCTLYAFDSFKGLPELKGIDRGVYFYEGEYYQSREDFEKILNNYGIKQKEYEIIDGFYEDILSKTVLEEKAAVVYVDCDLYESTKEVFKFIKSYLQTGTMVLFDDYFHFGGDREKGESRAVKEFLEENLDIIFRPHSTFGVAGKMFICNKLEKI